MDLESNHLVSKAQGVALGLANARPPGLTMCANAPHVPGCGWAQLVLVIACMLFSYRAEITNIGAR